MKITHVIWGLKYGGAETMLVNIMNQEALLHEVEVLLINNNIDDSLLKQIDSRIKINRINRPLKSKNPLYLFRLNRHILFSDSDIIHFHQDDIIRYLPARFFKRNFCLTVHSVQMDVEEVKKYNYLFAISDAVKTSILHKTGKEAILVTNGINVRKFNTKKRNWETEVFKIAQIGRLNHLKGQHIALSAIYQLITRYNRTNVHLDFIGDGDSMNFLKKLARELNINEYVSFLGTKTSDYIRENLSYYDLLIQPSFLEGFGLTIVEAMSAKTPTLISNVDGMKTISQNGTFSYTFKVGDENDCAGKLNQIIHLPANERGMFAENAYNYTLNQFDISSTINNYLSNYEKIIGQIKK
jgi:glycosyltransferase involved in cell wall biosynthesis